MKITVSQGPSFFLRERLNPTLRCLSFEQFSIRRIRFLPRGVFSVESARSESGSREAAHRLTLLLLMMDKIKIQNNICTFMTRGGVQTQL